MCALCVSEKMRQRGDRNGVTVVRLVLLLKEVFRERVGLGLKVCALCVSEIMRQRGDMNGVTVVRLVCLLKEVGQRDGTNGIESVCLVRL